MIVLARTRAQLEYELHLAETSDPELADTIRAALSTDDSSPAWSAAEIALRRRPLNDGGAS